MKKHTLTKKDTEKVAALAKLSLTPEQVDKFTAQLSETLESVEVLETLPTKNIPGTSQVTGLVNIFREDVVVPSMTRENMLSNAKHTHNGYFLVPYVFE
jgi:aspartyl-tRNA(Asn)/glutamyl-tRNA(Gln) amidotransferase subunit C